jgi:hypothetical protein
MPAGEHAGVKDDPVEDVLLRNREHMLDSPKLVAVTRVDGGAPSEGEIRARRSEVRHGAEASAGLVRTRSFDRHPD